MAVMYIPRVAILAIVVALSGHVAAQGRLGHVIGRATDPLGSPLPGVKVTVAGNGVRREAITGSDGRFDVTGIPAGVYEATAELAGFERQSQQVALTTSDSTLEISFGLNVGQLCEVDYVDLGFSNAVIGVDAILYVRVIRVEPTKPIRKVCTAGATTYEATIIEGVKTRSQGVQPSTIQWVQDSQSIEEHLGQDYLVFLTWDGSRSRYNAANGRYVFPIRDGTVQFHGNYLLRMSDGDSIEHVTSEIRAMLASRP
jgi:hypothetical protein